MTVSSTTSRKTYLGDAVTTSFDTNPVAFFLTSDLVVNVVTTATGVATLLTENTHYTVSGGSGTTGTVSLAGGSSPYGAPSALQTLVVSRSVPQTQAVDFVNNEATDAEVAEDALDKLTMICQQLQREIDISFHLADTDVSGASTVIPTPSANKVIGWNSAGTALQNYAGSDISLTLVSTFISTLIDDLTAAAARTTLGAAASGANTDITSLAAGVTLTNPVNTTQALTHASPTTWNATLGASATWAITASVALSAPTNLKTGGRYVLHVTQDGTGGRQITWNAAYKAAGGGAMPQPVGKASSTTTFVFDSPDGSTLQLVSRSTARTRTVLTSGTAATYTTPAGCVAINVREVGAGAGGGAASSNSGTAGGDTTFGTLIAKGGSGGGNGASNGGAGGRGGVSGTGTADIRVGGNDGASGAKDTGNPSGGKGGDGPWGGSGTGGITATGGTAAQGYGSGGGGGGGALGAVNSAGGGGAGEYVEHLIVNPAATYTYTVGAKGTGGAAGTYGGGNGSDGVIIVDEIYS